MEFTIRRPPRYANSKLRELVKATKDSKVGRPPQVSERVSKLRELYMRRSPENSPREVGEVDLVEWATKLEDISFEDD